MALNTYAALKTSIADFLNRSDLTAIIPDFISLAEAEMNRRIRMAALVKRADATVDSEYTSFPSDLQQIKSLYLKTSPIKKLVFLTTEEMAAKKSSGYKTTGNPDYFSIIGSTFQVLPAPDADVTAELIYHSKINALSDTNTSNDVLSQNPDVYLYTALKQSAPYLQDDQRITTWATLSEKAFENIEIQDSRAEYSGGDLRTFARAY